MPGLRNPDQVTLLEEDRISAYYGGGTLYAEPSRLGPLAVSGTSTSTSRFPACPQALPAGERMLWQGAPSWRALARRSLHVRKVGGRISPCSRPGTSSR